MKNEESELPARPREAGCTISSSPSPYFFVPNFLSRLFRILPATNLHSAAASLIFLPSIFLPTLPNLNRNPILILFP